MTDLTTRALGEAIAALIAADDAFSWAPDLPLDPAAATAPVVLGFQPVAPDRVVTVTALPMGDDPAMPLGLLLVQVRARGGRGRPLDAGDLLDLAFVRLHGVTGLPVAGGAIVQCLRQNRVPLGTDDLDRTDAADHYTVTVDYPPTDHRPDGGAW